MAASAFVLNKNQTKALFIHHNILNKWAWPGGHADGDGDLLTVATREITEETGVTALPQSGKIASLDILLVPGHYKNGIFVSGHLHLDVAYVFIADEDEVRSVKLDENSGVEWFPIEKIVVGEMFNEYDVYLYTKLIQQAKEHNAK